MRTVVIVNIFIYLFNVERKLKVSYYKLSLKGKKCKYTYYL